MQSRTEADWVPEAACVSLPQANWGPELACASLPEAVGLLKARLLPKASWLAKPDCVPGADRVTKAAGASPPEAERVDSSCRKHYSNYVCVRKGSQGPLEREATESARFLGSP